MDGAAGSPAHSASSCGVGRDSDAGPINKAHAPDDTSEAAANDFDAQLAEMDRALVKAQTALVEPIGAAPARRVQSPYDEDSNEEERFAGWRSVLHQTPSLPPLLAAAILWDA